MKAVSDVPDVKGENFGFKVQRREGHNPLVILMTEDDEFWSETSIHFDAYWIDDLMDTLKELKRHKIIQKWERKQRR